VYIIDNAGLKPDELRGKVAVITGAGQGIGRETARILAHLGASVVIAEVNETGRETEQTIRSEGGQALFVPTDVGDPPSIDRLHQSVLSAFGRAHILINNAEANKAKSLLDHTLEEWDAVFAVNMRGAFLAIRAFLPEMLEQKQGTVITMQSSDGMPYMSAYLASKVGLRSLAMSLAGEVGGSSGVSVYCFGPGMVDTPGLQAGIHDLAPLYGVSEEEFIRMAAPGGQLTPAELCATGLVGTILHAPDFHGQETLYVVGLSKLGLAPSGERWELGAGPLPSQTPVSTPASGGDGDLHERAIALSRRMEDVLRDNVREYGELSVFQRPVIKRMFQQGTGLKVEDWLAGAEDMTRRLVAVAQGDQDQSLSLDPSRLAAYVAQLRRMAGFLTKQESDARGWIKDPAKLRLALEALQARKETTLALADVLTQV
jgi:NAD(P)-dependent dehydrogenase (short-subunit alcohol dehydrogenase family)